MRVLVDAEEDVERVDERALARARAGELLGHLERRVEREAVEDPAAPARVRVRAEEPGADLVVEDHGVAARAHGGEQGLHLAHDGREGAEV